MSLLEFIQLIIRNKNWVLYFPLVVGIGVFLFTRNTPNTYTSEMIIYTGIASGFNPDNDFENKIDFHAVNSRFDNLINIIGSRETQKSIGLKLLTFMTTHPEQRATLIENAKSSFLKQQLSEEFIKKFQRPTEDETEALLTQQLDSGAKNVVYQLIYGGTKNPFNVNVLADIKAERKGFSDMLKISYTAEDPFTCKKTLDITSDLFLKKYQNMRIGEANQAVKYFQDQTAIAKSKLQASEENLKKFRSANRVINYYEQTKYIADQNESIEKNASQLQMDLEGYKTALEKVEAKIGNRFLIILQSDKIVQTKNKLADELAKNGIDAVKNGTQSMTNSPTIESLKDDLKGSVDKLYALNNSTEGMPGKNLLDEWLRLTVAKQETESKLQVLTTNKVEFDKVFERYAPMGSELNKLEREVETTEKEYLNLLHNLNQAILRQRNLEVSETVSVIDDADLPVVPNPSKRIMLVVASVLSCVILVVTLLIIRQYIDNSLASPMRLEKVTGLKAATAFVIHKFEPATIDEMDLRSMERWQLSLMNEAGNIATNAAILSIPFNCSTAQMQAYLEKMIAYLQTQGQAKINLTTPQQFMADENTPCIVVADKIFPQQQPKILLDKMNKAFLFFDASQKLDEYQMQVLEDWKKNGAELQGILVNTTEEHISKYLGEIPRKRSKFRALVKRQFKRYAG